MLVLYYILFYRRSRTVIDGSTFRTGCSSMYIDYRRWRYSRRENQYYFSPAIRHFRRKIFREQRNTRHT